MKIIQQNLEDFLKEDYRIFIDTCSIMFKGGEYFENFCSVNNKIFKKYNKKIIIPTRVQDELNKLLEKDSTKNYAEKAKNILLKHKDIFEVRGEEVDSSTHADNVFLRVFQQFAMQYNLLLISADINLSKDILALKSQKSISRGSKEIKVVKICENGILDEAYLKNDGFLYYKNADKQTQKTSPNIKNNTNNNSKSIVPKLRECTQIRNKKDQIIKTSFIPENGNEVVYTIINNKKQEIQLNGKLGGGGEGDVFETNFSNFIAKIYKKDRITEYRKEKISLLIDKKIAKEGICAPLAILYNQYGEFVGYLMQKAKGKTLDRSLFTNKNSENFPKHWSRKDLIELVISILNQIAYLHDNNVIMGDINGENIMVESPTKIYLVDCDSYQLEDLPCGVGKPEYTPPELQGKNFNEFLRNKTADYFALAILLFSIMMPGRNPYSQQGGSATKDNIKSGNFPYRFGEGTDNKNAPKGHWAFIWSFFPYYIKKAFWNVFQKGGNNYKPAQRLTAKQWLKLFHKFKNDFDRLLKNDEMNLDIFPNRFKKAANVTYVRCKKCGKEIEQGISKNGLCYECNMQVCTKCGKKVSSCSIENGICRDCNNTRFCKTCGSAFTISPREKDFYVKKGLSLPLKCGNCRQGNGNKQFNYTGTKQPDFSIMDFF